MPVSLDLGDNDDDKCFGNCCDTNDGEAGFVGAVVEKLEAAAVALTVGKHSTVADIGGLVSGVNSSDCWLCCD